MTGGTGSHGEDARAHLQARLRVLSLVLAYGFGGFMLFVAELYRLYPRIEPVHASPILAGAAALVVLLVVVGTGFLQRPRSIRVLDLVDILYALSFGIWLGCSALFSWDLRAAGYTALLLGIFVVFTRAILLPTSARRTAAVSSLLLGFLMIAAIALPFIREQDLPAPAYILGAFVLGTVATVLATLGSSVLHGLRRNFDKAVQLGRYTLDAKIGEGGMGIVYRAHHVLLRRPTAIKLLQRERVGADALDRFEREVQHTSQLTHPNTIAVYDYGRSPDGEFYYAMEYLDGVDLEKLVKMFGPQPAGRVVRILEQVCGALQEAHDRGLIHRDIKPANIILCERGAVPDVAKVVDFGLVKEIAADANTTQIILGTPSFLSPEAITAPETIGPAADLYALGAVGYFLLTGRRLFEGATSLDICLKHVTATPAPLSELAPDVPDELAAILMRCVAKSPEARYPNATALARALRAADPGDWIEDNARRWWAAKSVLANVQALSGARTQTITIDIGSRADQQRGDT